MKKSEKIILFFLLFILVGLIGFLEFLRVEKKLKSKNTGYVYFLKSGTENSYLFRVKREIPWKGSIEKKVNVLINYLLEGPTDEEIEAGVSTSIPEGVKLLGVKIRNGVVYLDFSEKIEEGGGTSLMETRLAQIVYTVTQFPPVDKVRLLIDGKEIKYFSSEGIMVDKLLTRNDFKEFENVN